MTRMSIITQIVLNIPWRRDLNNDVLHKKGEVKSFFKIKKCEEIEYFKIMRELNYKQRQYCNHICNQYMS